MECLFLNVHNGHFTFKRTWICFQIFMGVVCVFVIFSVFHLPGVSEAYCFVMTSNIRSRETKITLWAWSWWIKHPQKQPVERPIENFFQSQTLAYSWSLFQGCHGGLRLKSMVGNRICRIGHAKKIEGRGK